MSVAYDVVHYFGTNSTVGPQVNFYMIITYNYTIYSTTDSHASDEPG